MIDDYFEKIRGVIAASPIIRASSVTLDRRGDLFFGDHSRLHGREFIFQSQDAPAVRYTYAYHYQRADGTLIFRYDNTAPFRDLPQFPHHKHVGSEKVIPFDPPDLATVLKEIEGRVK